jgi:hypothetical protein
MKQFSFFVLGAMALALTSCDPKTPTTPGSLTLEFEHFWANNVAFELNTPYVVPMSSDTLTFTKLKYYISNITLTTEDGTTWTDDESYYLVDVSKPLTAMITLENVPAGTYTHADFMIGVDSARNVSGAQSGALDVTNDMFWSWNTGYIFIKAEGTSPQATGMGSFALHLGGFQAPNAAMQSLSFHFPEPAVVHGDASPMAHFSVRPDFLWCDDGTCFPGVGVTPMIMMPGAGAAARAAGFGHGIALEHIHN